jgi:hypothetical protein
MAQEDPTQVFNSNSSAISPSAPDAEVYLAAQVERARDAIIKSYRVVKIPDYFLNAWLPLLGPSRWLTVLAFRQLAFVHRCTERTGSQPTKTTLRELARWSGQSRPQMHKLLRKPQLLSWFVQPAEGTLGAHPGGRSERRTYLVRIEIPLTPRDQAKLQGFLRQHRPTDDEGWLNLLHGALAAKEKESELPAGVALPDSPLTIQRMVGDLRGADQPLSEELDWACDELLERWQTQNFGQMTHYFVKRWLPHLTAGLACLLIWTRRHANLPHNEAQVGQVRVTGWRTLAQAVGVTPKTVRRWFSDAERYPHTPAFISPSAVYAGAGEVEQITADSIEVAGQTFAVLQTTLIKDPIRPGDMVRLTAERSDGRLLARSLELAHQADVFLRLHQTSLRFDVKLTEPIHPDDREHYRLMLAEGDPALSAGSLLRPNTGPGTGNQVQAGTKVDKPFVEIDIEQPKVDASGPSIDKPLPEKDNGRPEINYLSTKVEISTPEVDSQPTEMDALRGSLRNNKNLSKISQQELPLAPSTTIHEPSPNPEQAELFDSEAQEWNIASILAQGAIPTQDRQLILSGGWQLQEQFIAWLLWSMATRTIDVPVLHAVSRVRRGEEAPRGFGEIASASPNQLAQWLGRGHWEGEAPPEHRQAVRQLRRNDAYDKLVALGAIPRELRIDREAAQRKNEGGEEGGEEGEKARSLRAAVNAKGLTAEDAWRRAKGTLQIELPPATFDNWVRDIELEDFSGNDTLVLLAANPYARDWLSDRLVKVVQHVLEGVTGRSLNVRFVSPEDLG